MSHGAGDAPLTWAGEYNPSSTYLPRQVITAAGQIFMALSRNTGHAPPDGAYWLSLSGAGTGISSTAGPGLPSTSGRSVGDLHYDTDGKIQYELIAKPATSYAQVDGADTYYLSTIAATFDWGISSVPGTPATPGFCEAQIAHPALLNGLAWWNSTMAPSAYVTAINGNPASPTLTDSARPARPYFLYFGDHNGATTQVSGATPLLTLSVTATPPTAVLTWTPVGGTDAVNVIAASGAGQGLPDVDVATMHRITLTAPCALTFPAPAAGKSFTLTLKQDATGSRTVTWPAPVVWPGGTAPTLTTTPGKADVFKFLADDATNWRGSVVGLNY